MLAQIETPTDPELLADEIARTATHIDAATHRLLSCIRAFDASGEWHRQGAISCAHWLSWRIHLDLGTAREKVRVARALGQLPAIDDALRRGVLSYAKARALSRVATPANEGHLLSIAHHATGAQLERFCRSLRRVVDLDERGNRPDDYRTVKDEVLENGLVRLTIVLHADEAALVMKAIEKARRGAQGTPKNVAARDGARIDGEVESRPGEDPQRSGAVPARQAEALAAADQHGNTGPETAIPAPAAGGISSETSQTGTSERRRLPPKADALVTIALAYLTHGDASGSAAQRTQLVVHLDQDPLVPDHTLAATLDDGTRLSAEALRRLSCDATVVPVHHSAKGPRLDLGRSTRTVPLALRRALALRDQGCRFPGCTHRLFLHAHHIHHWAHGGPTSLANLLSTCTHHHRLLHEGGFGVKRTAGGDLVFTGPRGETIEAVPAPWELDGDGLAAITSWNETRGVQIDADTAYPAWDGEPMDYAWAVDTLLRA